MAEINYEKEYDNRARVPEHPQIFARWATDAESYRASLSSPQLDRVNYGPTTREMIDLFDARPGAPLAVFIHGGWWRNFDPSLFSHFAIGLNAHQIGVALPGYNLCPQVGIADIIEEMRRALLALWGRYHTRMLVLGHSAGGHLTAALLATDWPSLDPTAPKDLVPVGRAGPGCLNRISASISGASAGLGCQAEGQRGEVGLIGCRAVKARMRSAAVVEVQVAADRSAGLADAVVGSQVHLLVFDAAPQPFDEHVVAPGPFAVHADGDAVAGEQAVKAVPVNCEP